MLQFEEQRLRLEPQLDELNDLADAIGIEKIKGEVYRKFKVSLEPEVEFIKT